MRCSQGCSLKCSLGCSHCSQRCSLGRVFGCSLFTRSEHLSEHLKTFGLKGIKPKCSHFFGLPGKNPPYPPIRAGAKAPRARVGVHFPGGRVNSEHLACG